MNAALPAPPAVRLLPPLPRRGPTAGRPLSGPVRPQRLLVLGASGLIGSELYHLARAAGRRVAGTFSSNPRPGLTRFDLRRGRLRDLWPDLGPDDVVYLLSAYSSPSWIHDHLDEAHDLNVTATRRIADEVAAAQARLVFMSSVEVFDGRTGAYTEDAVPAPLNAYGRMKHEIEQHLATLDSPTCIVRTGWNVGWTTARRCVVRLTYESLLAPGALMATDNTFSLADVRDTAAGLLRLADHPAVSRLHLASSPRIVRRELADFIIAHSTRGARMHYRPVAFRDIPYSEPRARCNHLDASFARELLGLSFRPTADIIRAKVRLMDAEGAHAP